jgi:hypothetical protein
LLTTIRLFLSLLAFEFNLASVNAATLSTEKLGLDLIFSGNVNDGYLTLVTPNF